MPKPIRVTPEGAIGMMKLKRLQITLFMARIAIMVAAFVIMLHLYDKL